MRLAAPAVAAVAMLLTSCAPDPPGAVIGLETFDSCRPGRDIGSGMVVAPGIALTSAHVLAGAEEIVIHHGARESSGTIIAFDPDMDLAYVSFDAVPTRTLAVDSSHVERDDSGTAYVVRGDSVVPVPVRITRRVDIRTEDIYVEGETRRPGFELEADIRAGDSGGAVVVDGKIVGVVWARSNQFDRRAYAIDAVRAADLVEEQLATGALGDDVDITRCR